MSVSMPAVVSRGAVCATALVLLLVVNGLTPSLGADKADAPSPPQVRRRLDEARALLEAGKPSKAGRALGEATKQLQVISELDRVPSGARALAEACQSLKEDLELEGIDVTGIEIPSIRSKTVKTDKPLAMKPENTTDASEFFGKRPAVAGGAQGVSFVGQIAPLLMSRCGGCHVTGRKGGFQIQSYEALMKSNSVQRGVGNASRLVEVIESGDMPRGGGEVSPEELSLLVRWIDAGAAFDGPDPTVGIDLLAQGQKGGGPLPRKPAAAAAPSVPVVLKPGDVSFAFDIAPVLLRNCAGCHDDDDPAEGLSMATFARLVRGGESGPAFVAGKSADSLLVRKIKGSKGIDGQRMPIGKPPLTAEVIGLIEKWIDQGARLDLRTPQDSLETVAAAGRARSLSHDALAKVRFDDAEKFWRRALADEEPVRTVEGDVCVVANLPESRVEQVAEACGNAMRSSRDMLVGEDQPLLKGGVAVFAFAKAYDYSNFWQTALSDERPKGLVGNAGLAGDVVYGAFVVPSSAQTDEDATSSDLTALAAEQIVMAALVARGAPEWFARGAGRTVAAKTAPKASLVREWKSDATEALQRLGSPDDFFGGHAGPVATAAIAGGFVAAIATQDAKLRAVVEALDAGASFDKAFDAVFRMEPKRLFEAWAAKAAKQARLSGSGRR